MALTPKQEAFCLAYIETGNASEAYRRSYSAGKMKPESIAVKASELLKNGKITVRLEELRADHQNRHNVTVDSLTLDLQADRQLARGNDQASAAIQATVAIARLYGLADRPPPLDFDVPSFTDAQSILNGLAAVIQAVSKGQITLDEAERVSRLLREYRQAYDASVLEDRLRAVEQRLENQ